MNNPAVICLVIVLAAAGNAFAYFLGYSNGRRAGALWGYRQATRLNRAWRRGAIHFVRAAEYQVKIDKVSPVDGG